MGVRSEGVLTCSCLVYISTSIRCCKNQDALSCDVGIRWRTEIEQGNHLQAQRLPCSMFYFSFRWLARYCPPPAASILAAPLMKAVTSRCSFSRDFFSMYIMWPASYYAKLMFLRID